MLGTRYEEYTVFSDHIPFKITFGIKRSRTLFSPDVNWHESPEVQLCRSGEGLVMLDGKQLPFAAGDVAVANSGVLHHTGTQGTIEYDCLILDTEFCRRCGIDATKLRFAEHFRDSEIEAIFSELQAVRAAGGELATAKQQLLALRLLIRLCEEHLISAPVPQVKSSTYRSVTAALTYIRNHYAERLTLDDLSKSVYVNKYTLTRIFREMTGQTVVEYTNSYRCRQAARLIREGCRVGESARLCGFSNMSFFTKTFKRYIGKLPSEYQSETDT